MFSHTHSSMKDLCHAYSLSLFPSPLSPFSLSLFLSFSPFQLHENCYRYLLEVTFSGSNAKEIQDAGLSFSSLSHMLSFLHTLFLFPPSFFSSILSLIQSSHSLTLSFLLFLNLFLSPSFISLSADKAAASQFFSRVKGLDENAYLEVRPIVYLWRYFITKYRNTMLHHGRRHVAQRRLSKLSPQMWKEASQRNISNRTLQSCQTYTNLFGFLLNIHVELMFFGW